MDSASPVYIRTVDNEGRWNSIVGTVMRLQARRPRVPFPAGTRDLSFLQNVKTGSRAYRVSCLVGAGGTYRGVERPEREGDN
jgi:hypothetical protein